MKKTVGKFEIKVVRSIFVLFFFFIFLSNVSALSIAVHVPEKYVEVYSGERFYFELDVKYPENTFRKDLRLEYVILSGEEIVSRSNVLKAIETQSSFIDFIVIPEGAKEGLHEIRVEISDYEDLNKQVSASFYVVSDGSDQIRNYFFILLFSIVFIGFLVLLEVHKISKKRRG